MTHPDVDLLTRRLDILARTAAAVRAHAGDLWVLGWEQPNTTDPLERERVSGDDPVLNDHAPRAGDPRARRLFDQICVNVAQMEAELVGFERATKRLFFVGSRSAEPTRGSLIPAGEHARLLANQRARAAAGDYTPERLIDQPPHPGRHR